MVYLNVVTSCQLKIWWNFSCFAPILTFERLKTKQNKTKRKTNKNLFSCKRLEEDKRDLPFPPLSSVKNVVYFSLLETQWSDLWSWARNKTLVITLSLTLLPSLVNSSDLWDFSWGLLFTREICFSAVYYFQTNIDKQSTRSYLILCSCTCLVTYRIINFYFIQKSIQIVFF